MKIFSDKFERRNTTAMENTALVRLFDLLSSAEKRRIKKKLEYTERSGVDMLLLFNYLDKNIEKPTKLDKELVYKAVFGKLKKLNDAKLTQLRFKLYRYIEDQIVIDQIMGINKNKEHLIQRELILLEYFRDKVVPNDKGSVQGIAKLVEGKMTDVENLIKSTEVRDNYYHLNLFRLSHYLYYSLNEEIRGEGKPYLDQLMNNLDIFFCLSKLRYSFEIIQRQKVYNETKVPFFLFDEAYNYSENLNADKFPLVSIYKLLADLSIRLDKSKIIKLKNILLDNVNLVGRAEMVNAINILLNFTIQISRENKIDMAIEQYDIYKFILKNNIYIANGEIRPQFLINCAANFVRAQKSREIEEMLKDYSDNIPKNYRKKTLRLCASYQLFGEGAFEKCCKLIYKKSFHPFNLQAKILLLQSIYEIEFTLNQSIEFSFFDALDNFRRFVKRRTGKMNKNLCEATINFYVCLLKLSNNTDKILLEKHINSLDFLVERRWLLNKAKKK